MDTLDKSTPLWQKLRKQKLAQKARLENRRKEFKKNDEVSKLERVIQEALTLSMEYIPEDQKEAVHELLRAEIPNFDAQYELKKRP